MQSIIQLARKHVGNGAPMESSARICLADSIRFSDEGRLRLADVHAIKSLAYSVGICHRDYRRAWESVYGSTPISLPTSRQFFDAIDADEKILA